MRPRCRGAEPAAPAPLVDCGGSSGMEQYRATREATPVIDPDGYRPSVGMVVSNRQRMVVWARRIGRRDAWQFPQGGIHHGETPEDALFRELYEELGLRRDSVEVLGATAGWLRYDIPRQFLRRDQDPVCIGQKQRWFLLRLLSDDGAIRIDAHSRPEFDRWRWVDYWSPAREVVFFKRVVYRRALGELAPILGVDRRPVGGHPPPCTRRRSGSRWPRTSRSG